MKKGLNIFLTFLILFNMFFPVFVVDAEETSVNVFAGGTGTLTDPYLISTPEQLDAIRYNLDANFKLINDIDLSTATASSNGAFYNEGAGWDPINFFAGSIDGDNHKIMGMHIVRDSSDIGLIGASAASVTVTIKNLEISNVSIHGSNNYVGSICGRCNYIDLENVKVDSNSSISGSVYVGGLVGRAIVANIKDSYNSSSMYVSSQAGGLIGLLTGDEGQRSSITGSYNTGRVSITNVALANNIGGVVGIAKYADISKVYNSGSVISEQNTSEIVGGIVGSSSYNTITDVYNLGNVTAGNTVGGLIGTVKETTVRNGYNDAEVTSPSKVLSETISTTLDTESVIENVYTTSTMDNKYLQDNYQGFDFDNTWNSLEGLTPRFQLSEINTLLNRNYLIIDSTTENTIDLKTVVSPASAYDKTLNYTSSNESIIIVSNATVGAVSLGTADIVISANNSNASETITFDVVKQFKADMENELKNINSELIIPYTASSFSNYHDETTTMNILNYTITAAIKSLSNNYDVELVSFNENTMIATIRLSTVEEGVTYKTATKEIKLNILQGNTTDQNYSLEAYNLLKDTYSISLKQLYNLYKNEEYNMTKATSNNKISSFFSATNIDDTLIFSPIIYYLDSITDLNINANYYLGIGRNNIVYYVKNVALDTNNEILIPNQIENTEEAKITAAIDVLTQEFNDSSLSFDIVAATESDNGYSELYDDKTTLYKLTITDASHVTTALVTIKLSNPIGVSDVYLNKNDLTLTLGSGTISEQLLAVINPSNASEKDVEWTSSNNNVAIVDENGVVTAIGNGTANIIVTTKDGAYTDTCKVTVTTKLEDIKITNEEIVLSVDSSNNTKQLELSFNPITASNKEVTFISSDPLVAEVSSSGLVTAKSSGTAIVTATSVDGNIKSSILVLVLPYYKLALNQKVDISFLTDVYGASWSVADPEIADIESTNITHPDDYNYSASIIGLSKGITYYYLKDSSENILSRGIINVWSPVTEIVISNMALNLEINDSVSIDATAYPETADDTRINFMSEDSTIVTVNEYGQVTAVGNGKTRIRVSSNDGNVVKYVDVNVYIFTESVDIMEDEVHLDNLNLTKQLSYTVLPDTATYKDVNFTSSDSEIVTVSDEGLLTAKSNGTAIVTVETVDHNYTDQVTVTVTGIVNVTDVNIIEENVVLTTEGKITSLTLNYEILPLEATFTNVTFKSNDLSVVTVSEDGTLTPTGIGTTTVTLSNHNGKIVDTVNVEVIKGKYTLKVYKPNLIDDSYEYTLMATLDNVYYGEKINFIQNTEIFGYTFEGYYSSFEDGIYSNEVVEDTLITQDLNLYMKYSYNELESISFRKDYYTFYYKDIVDLDLGVTFNPLTIENAKYKLESSNEEVIKSDTDYKDSIVSHETNVDGIVFTGNHNTIENVSIIGIGTTYLSIYSYDGTLRDTATVNILADDAELYEFDNDSVILPMNTTIDDFYKKHVTNVYEDETIYSVSGNKVNDKDTLLGTGMTIEIDNKFNNQKSIYTIIVTGDLNGDGKLTITDLVRMRQVLVGNIELSDIELKASDVSGDSNVTITDLVNIRKYLVGLETW